MDVRLCGRLVTCPVCNSTSHPTSAGTGSSFLMKLNIQDNGQMDNMGTYMAVGPYKWIKKTKRVLTVVYMY